MINPVLNNTLILTVLTGQSFFCVVWYTLKFISCWSKYVKSHFCLFTSITSLLKFSHFLLVKSHPWLWKSFFEMTCCPKVLEFSYVFICFLQIIFNITLLSLQKSENPWLHRPRWSKWCQGLLLEVWWGPDLLKNLGNLLLTVPGKSTTWGIYMASFYQQIQEILTKILCFTRIHEQW